MFLPLHIVKGNGQTLLGRDWLKQLKINWGQVKKLNGLLAHTPILDIVLRKHDDVLKNELGTFTGTKAKIVLDTNAVPLFNKPRPLSYADREKVQHELDRLQNQGVISPVEFADWAAPIVVVSKPDNSIRICGDYSVTINKAKRVDKYPIPRIEDLYTTLAGGEKFTKLDLRNAYLQMQLDEQSKQYVTINTHRGLYTYNRLPFGLNSAPAIFQRVMDNLIKNIPHTTVYLDDILVTGLTEAEHLRNLDAVLQRLSDAGLRLKRIKCSFLVKEVDYLGYKLDAVGLHTQPEKVRPILDAPAPTNVAQLQSFLGMINYYSRFIPNCSTVNAPLYRMLSNDVPWAWTDNEARAFETAKRVIGSVGVLVHYDPTRPLTVNCDASQYGIGAVLAHKSEDGTDQPIAFSSRSLSSAEKNYSQLDKEALAMVFGVCKFHQYLYGRDFEIYTYHKPHRSWANFTLHIQESPE